MPNQLVRDVTCHRTLGLLPVTALAVPLTVPRLRQVMRTMMALTVTLPKETLPKVNLNRLMVTTTATVVITMPIGPLKPIPPLI